MIAAFLGLAFGMSSSPAQVPGQMPEAEVRRKASEEKLARAIEEEEKRAAAITAYEVEQVQRQRQLEREKQARDAQRERAAHEGQCQFKPVMSDEDIARCRAVYSR